MLTTAMQGGRDTSATERGKKGSANDGRASLKKSQEREQVQRERARWGSGRKEKFEEKAAAGQVEEVHHCWRGEGRMVGMEGQTDDKL